MNEKQLKAVKSLENTLVVAGAGSGKTFTIVNKIKYLLDNNIYKENELLVISFTNESVNDLKRKIDYNLDIMTFHKLAITLINNPNIKISNEYYLKLIINEYFSSYGKYNKKNNKLIKRILNEIDIDNLKKLIFTFINLYKSNYNNINYLFNLYQKSHFINKIYFKIILEIYHIYNQEYYYFSLFALNESILSISQAEYTLDHYLLKRDDPLCVSNEVKGDYTIIENNENIILVRSRDAK